MKTLLFIVSFIQDKTICKHILRCELKVNAVIIAGLKLAYKLFPEGLFTGTPPQSISGVKCKDPMTAWQTTFTFEDIDKVEIYLDGALQDKSIGSKWRNTILAIWNFIRYRVKKINIFFVYI